MNGRILIIIFVKSFPAEEKCHEAWIQKFYLSHGVDRGDCAFIAPLVDVKSFLVQDLPEEEYISQCNLLKVRINLES
jgi:hypothetical protein